MPLTVNCANKNNLQETDMHYFFSQLFKRKHRREYLYDEFTPKKSSFTIWVQRLIIFIVFFIILLFVLTFNTLAEASIENNKTSINMSRDYGRH